MVNCKTCGHPFCSFAGVQRGIVVKCDNYMPRQNPQTNADRIRAMSDEELAGWLARIANGDVYTDFCDNPARTVVCDNKCVGCIAEWLKQPVKDGEDE